MKKIRVLLVDDEAAVRRGLRMRLQLEPDLEVVGEAENGVAALELADRLHPEVVVMDVEMRAMDGIAAAGRLRYQSPNTAVVLLTIHDDPATKARAQEAGVAGFVAKHLADAELLPTIRGAAGSSRSTDETL